MDTITLNQVNKKGNRIAYDFSVSEGLSRFFSGKEFVIEYPENIEAVPNAVAAVPFVSNVLPIIWLTDSCLKLESLDKDFYECIDEVKKGYETMFPESTFAGRLQVEHIEKAQNTPDGGSAAFFSGGLDAVHTLISHLDEKPALISIWGADVDCENSASWELVHNGIREYADQYGLPDVVIRSTFRKFDNEGVLHNTFSEQLKDGWWHGVKHGLGLLGHAAPYAYLHGVSTVYIASSNCPSDGPVRCASNPLIDDYVRFANSRVVHDGFECSRQDKIHQVVQYQKNTGRAMPLHVCWESQDGGNCCYCEKCYRTMAGLLTENSNPVEFGFQNADRAITQMKRNLLNSNSFTAFLAETQWRHIQMSLRRNRDELKKQPYWKYIKWIDESDFTNIKSIKLPLRYRIRRHLSEKKWYQFLSYIKSKLLNR